MGLKYSEEQLKEMLKNNSKLKISGVIGGKTPLSDSLLNANKDNKIQVKENKKSKTSLISLLGENNDKSPIKKTKAKTSPGQTAYNITSENKKSKCSFSSSDEHVSFLFEGAKLLSVNQIFALLQSEKLKFQLFSYKKSWHDILTQHLNDQFILLKTQGKKLPYFDDSVEITLFRQASKLVDEDAMSTMFKFIIDGLKRHPEKNPYGILAEDNPKIVHRIICYSEKGESAVGIKVKKIKEMKMKFSSLDILEN